MRLVEPRGGEQIKVLQRRTAFSYWPTIQEKRREKLQSTLFATDPWILIRNRTEKVSTPVAYRQAQAYLRQARDFFGAAENSEVSAAKPLLLYYSFLNLAKCFIVTKQETALGAIFHGLSEKLPTTAGAIHGHVSVDIARNPGKSAFVLFARALGADASLPAPIPPNTHIEIRSQDFLAQVLVGHRVYCGAESIKERFVSLDAIEYMHNPEAKEAWPRARAYKDDFTRLGYPQTTLSKSLTGNLQWRNVKCSKKKEGRELIEAETIATHKYGQRPSQILNKLSREASKILWRSVTAYPPYRKYYLYRPATTQILLHQLLGLYLATFYFGSITRYKPEQFDNILKSPIGPFVHEFFTNQPSQFVYLLASEFIEQEVARAAIT